MENSSIILYTAQDIQKIFRCGKRQAYELLSSKGFPSIRVGKKILTEKKALEKWLDKYQGKYFIKN